MGNKTKDRAPSLQKLNVTDFMTIGIFFVIITLVGTVVSFVGITPITFVMISPIQGIVLGIPTMLFYSKVKKPGMLFIMALISGASSILLALGPYHLLIGVVLSLIAEGILWAGRYRSSRNSVLAYAVTALASTANYIPLFFATKRYIADTDIAGKYGQGMADGMADIGQHGLVIFAAIVGSTFVTAIVGGILGHKVFNKHFRRAGIV